MLKPLTLVTATLLSGVIAPAWAQRPDPAHPQPYPIPRDVQELERIHQLDEAERSPIAPLPKPKGSNLTQPLHPAKIPWRCVGAVPWQKVYAEPSTSSRVIGLSQAGIAATGAPVSGFYHVLFYNGIEGFFPAEQVHPFVLPDHPDTTCTFAGLTDNGSPRFAYRSSNDSLAAGQPSKPR